MELPGGWTNLARAHPVCVTPAWSTIRWLWDWPDHRARGGAGGRHDGFGQAMAPVGEYLPDGERAGGWYSRCGAVDCRLGDAGCESALRRIDHRRFHQPADAGPFAWTRLRRPTWSTAPSAVFPCGVRTRGVVRRGSRTARRAWGSDHVLCGTVKRSPTGFRNLLGRGLRVAADAATRGYGRVPRRPEAERGEQRKWRGDGLGGGLWRRLGASTSQLTLGRSPGGRLRCWVSFEDWGGSRAGSMGRRGRCLGPGERACVVGCPAGGHGGPGSRGAACGSCGGCLIQTQR
jgi:hypothetical protein